MIRVIRIDGTEILLNTEFIQEVKEDENKITTVVLDNGENIKIKSPVYDVVQKAKAYITGVREEERVLREAAKGPQAKKTPAPGDAPPERNKKPPPGNKPKPKPQKDTDRE